MARTNERELMSVFAIDYAWGRPGAAALQRAGVGFVCRYLSRDTTGKNLTRAEAERLSDAGIRLVVVWESTADRARSGKSGGVADARAVDAQVRGAGCPATGRSTSPWTSTPRPESRPGSTPIWRAPRASSDPTGSTSMAATAQPACPRRGQAGWAWQTYAWSAGRWDPRAHIRQYSNGHTLDGVGVDYDRGMTEDYGQWRVGVRRRDDDAPDRVVGRRAITLPG
jgi:hypothetical protein